MCGQDGGRSGGPQPGVNTLCERDPVREAPRPWEPGTWTLVCAQGAHPTRKEVGASLALHPLGAGKPHRNLPFPTVPNVRRKCYQFLWPHDGQDPGVCQKLLVVQPGLLHGQRTGGRDVRCTHLCKLGPQGSPNRDRPAQHRALGARVHLPPGPVGVGCSGCRGHRRPASTTGVRIQLHVRVLRTGGDTASMVLGHRVSTGPTQDTLCVCSRGGGAERARHRGRSPQGTRGHLSFSGSPSPRGHCWECDCRRAHCGPCT